ncbi:hypothetical protein RCO28_15815 [Streptomyces sp. LHD-70]|uniref:hypothetical protein n=1 Tax=Streptomyces sp. LHD-70 TaxID=3072140 RepID=UPI00280FDFDA|nr:hypothetical protein [Streptomyces sp. LHD-70]MDQ8703950.1 hypothetical protein [Streptomyces sp. LHD-70]
MSDSAPPHPERWLYLGSLAALAGFAVFAFGWVFAVCAGGLIGGGLLVVSAVRRGASALREGRTRRARLSFAVATAPVAFLGLLVSWSVGAFSGALDVGEACVTQQQHYDSAYRAQHAAEMNQPFPLRNACNADYDLVPGWVNPAVVLFAALLVASLSVLAAGFVRLLLNRRSHAIS